MPVRAESLVCIVAQRRLAPAALKAGRERRRDLSGLPA